MKWYDSLKYFKPHIWHSTSLKMSNNIWKSLNTYAPPPKQYAKHFWLLQHCYETIGNCWSYESSQITTAKTHVQVTDRCLNRLSDANSFHIHFSYPVNSGCYGDEGEQLPSQVPGDASQLDQLCTPGEHKLHLPFSNFKENFKVSWTREDLLFGDSRTWGWG